jgi:hypothetical protein
MILISTLGISPIVWAEEVVQRTCVCYALQKQAVLAEMKLDRSLTMLTLVQSRKRVAEPSASAWTLFISILPWRGAPFALYKCRAGAHRNRRAELDILEELLKCGFLKAEVVQARLAHDTKRLNRAAYGTETLAAISASWQGALVTEGSVVLASIRQGSSSETSPIVYCDDVDCVSVSNVREPLSAKNMADPTSFIDQVPMIRFVFMFHSVLILTFGLWIHGPLCGRGTATESDVSDIFLKLFGGRVNPDGTVNEDLLSPIAGTPGSMEGTTGCTERVGKGKCRNQTLFLWSKPQQT